MTLNWVFLFLSPKNWVFFSSFQILLQVSSSDWHFTIHSWCLPYPSGTNTFFCIFAFEKRCPLSSTSVVRTGYLVYRFQINTTPGQISSHWQTVVSKKPHKLFFLILSGTLSCQILYHLNSEKFGFLTLCSLGFASLTLSMLTSQNWHSPYGHLDFLEIFIVLLILHSFSH